MNRNILVGIVVFVLAIFGIIFYLGKSKTSQPKESPARSTTQISSYAFQNPQKTAHWESNTPEHGSTLAGVPVNVVIDFNFDLATPSAISIKKDGQDYGVGQTQIDRNKLSMRREMNPQAADGVYTVEYRACWADGSCHDGHFQFAIDRKVADSYEDMRGKSEVAVSLKNISFNPRSLNISRGTRVTWTNNDSVEHTVNTDAHPAHTYYLSQNSSTLKTGDTYAVTFEKPGIYLYHCTPHAGSMTGSILVE